MDTHEIRTQASYRHPKDNFCTWTCLRIAGNNTKLIVPIHILPYMLSFRHKKMAANEVIVELPLAGVYSDHKPLSVVCIGL